MMSLDAHERPPEHIRHVYKKYQKLRGNALNDDPQLLDPRDSNAVDRLHVVRFIDPTDLRSAFQDFAAAESSDSLALPDTPVPVYEHRHMPGLHIIPSLLPDSTQRLLLSRLIHRDLSNPAHQTNVHLHYHVPYPPESSSFFGYSPSSEPHFQPKDPQVHKPLSITQFLNRKLRWVTLGGQYDWTRKEYPSTMPPPFPSDVGGLLKGVFPDMTAQAAIVNFYSPGDTLSMHRDVSEECDRGLIIPETCPEWLQDWPASSQNLDADEAYQQWKGWMRTKRVNLNVRQMWE
ncbi:Alkylated DNA repair protein [Lasiodiplodia theobromae]|uniref:Alkylated DNA repair protein n=1 Tax=Lasiodiplodia theobromae TaxID=45133 RepID=UPI0015C3224A|nr:Alkylated DNA repair protein [Lasiodiplodia theobromae]KAF4543226.1 Alkylated DNA repair protein [Lasiodiplodia theobromae]